MNLKYLDKQRARLETMPPKNFIIENKGTLAQIRHASAPEAHFERESRVHLVADAPRPHFVRPLQPPILDLLSRLVHCIVHLNNG